MMNIHVGHSNIATLRISAYLRLKQAITFAPLKR